MYLKRYDGKFPSIQVLDSSKTSFFTKINKSSKMHPFSQIENPNDFMYKNSKSALPVDISF